MSDGEGAAASTSNLQTNEGGGDEEGNQILFMLDRLSPIQRRRTLLLLRPLLSSTVVDQDIPKPTEQEASNTNADVNVNTSNTSVLTSTGEVTLASGSSRILIQTSSTQSSVKLKSFSGILPVPNGQIDFRTWHQAATRLSKNSSFSEIEQLSRIQNSLLKPALDVVQSSLDLGSTSDVLKLLDQVYGNVDDPRDLLNNFNSSCQNAKERCSEYLSRLYLLLDELLRLSIVAVADARLTLLKQFIYGCSDDTLLLKLRLEEKEHNPPDYGSLLLSIRREEAKRTRRQVAARVKTQQVSVENSEVEALKCEVNTLKQEVASLKLQQQHVTAENHGEQTGDRYAGARPKKRFGFCFRCGKQGHSVWNCRNDPNPTLVTKLFENAKN